MFGTFVDRTRDLVGKATDGVNSLAAEAYKAPLRALNLTDDAIATLAAKTDVKALVHLSTIIKDARKGEIAAKAAILLGVEVISGKAEAEILIALCEAGLLEDFIALFKGDDEPPKLPPTDDTSDKR